MKICFMILVYSVCWQFLTRLLENTFGHFYSNHVDSEAFVLFICPGIISIKFFS